MWLLVLNVKVKIRENVLNVIEEHICINNNAYNIVLKAFIQIIDNINAFNV